MNVGSACSGAGFMDLGWHRAGLRTVWFCEADAYRRDVLARHWPGVPAYDDLTTLDATALERIDLLAVPIGVSPADAQGSAGSEPICSGISSGCATSSSRDGRCERTFPACSPRTAAGTSLSSWAPWWAPMSLFPPEDGRARVWQPDRSALALGGSSTLNGSECPNDAAGCSLSLILEAQAPGRFFLSGRAAAGVLRRARKRGRALPRRLHDALEALAHQDAERRMT